MIELQTKSAAKGDRADPRDIDNTGKANAKKTYLKLTRKLIFQSPFLFDCSVFAVAEDLCSYLSQCQQHLLPPWQLQ